MSQPVTSQPIAVVSPVTMSSEGSWSTGRYDFWSDIPMCCVGMFCPSILGCYVSHKYGEHWCLGFVPGGMTALRTHMRLAYGIPGTVWNDALSMFFCGWCELCRMSREVFDRSRSKEIKADVVVVEMSNSLCQPSLFYHLGVRESYSMTTVWPSRYAKYWKLLAILSFMEQESKM